MEYLEKHSYHNTSMHLSRVITKCVCALAGVLQNWSVYGPFVVIPSSGTNMHVVHYAAV